MYLVTDEKFIPWYCVNTVLPWHSENTMLLWKYYEYVSTKVLKIALLKHSQYKGRNNNAPFRLLKRFPDLRFPINTYHRCFFIVFFIVFSTSFIVWKTFFPMILQTRSCNSPGIWSPWSWHIWRILIQVYSIFTNIHMTKQIIPAFLCQ